MALPAALGANLWIVAVVLPIVLAQAWRELVPGRGPAMLVALILVSPTVLALGLVRRSAIALLMVFPASAALPSLLFADRPTASAASPPFVVSALSLVAYLFAVAHALARAGSVGDPQPLAAQRLPEVTMPARWRRRMRVYRAINLLSVLFPAVLIAYADLYPPTAAAIAKSFGARAASAQALITVGIGLLWIGVYRAYLLGPLDGHLHHDRAVRQSVEAARRQARRGRPRPSFYLAVLLALAMMAAVLWQRTHR
jgi:hypothetical protein